MGKKFRLFKLLTLTICLILLSLSVFMVSCSSGNSLNDGSGTGADGENVYTVINTELLFGAEKSDGIKSLIDTMAKKYDGKAVDGNIQQNGKEFTIRLAFRIPSDNVDAFMTELKGNDRLTLKKEDTKFYTVTSGEESYTAKINALQSQIDDYTVRIEKESSGSAEEIRLENRRLELIEQLEQAKMLKEEATKNKTMSTVKISVTRQETKIEKATPWIIILAVFSSPLLILAIIFTTRKIVRNKRENNKVKN